MQGAINASVMTYIRTKVRFALLRSSFATKWGFRGKRNDVHLPRMSDIDFSIIPRLTVMYNWIIVSMKWRRSYLHNRWINLISHDIMNEIWPFLEIYKYSAY